jgi:fibronectin type 3 domain-containing protein
MHTFILTITLLSTLALLSACEYSGSSSSEKTSAQGTAGTGTNQSTAGTDSVSLSWIPPTTRADGSTLQAHELAGYRIYMGTSSSSLQPLLDLDDETISQYTVEKLQSGEYYFAVSAYDTDGLESQLSQIILMQAG